MAEWDFYEYEEPGSGARPFDSWLLGLPEDAQAHIEDKILYAEKVPRHTDKLIKPLKGYEGIFEFRPSFRNVMYRPLMCRHPKDAKGFVFLEGAIERNWKIAKQHLTNAANRRSELIKDPSRAKLR